MLPEEVLGEEQPVEGSRQQQQDRQFVSKPAQRARGEGLPTAGLGGRF